MTSRASVPSYDHDYGHRYHEEPDVNTNTYPVHPRTLRPVLLALALGLAAILTATAILGVETSSGSPATAEADPAEPVDAGPRIEYETLAIIEVGRLHEEAQLLAYYDAVAEAEAERARIEAARLAEAQRAAATPPPAPAPQAGSENPAPEVTYAAGSIEEMICATFGAQCAGALRVVQCESNFNTGTVGAAGERGLFQIHPVHIPYLADRGMSWDAMFDPAANIAYAYDLFSRSGWGPWTCKP